MGDGWTDGGKVGKVGKLVDVLLRLAPELFEEAVGEAARVRRMILGNVDHYDAREAEAPIEHLMSHDPYAHVVDLYGGRVCEVVGNAYESSEAEMMLAQEVFCRLAACDWESALSEPESEPETDESESDLGRIHREMDAKYIRCGPNGDWAVTAWHLGRSGKPGTMPNWTSGDFYVLDIEDGTYQLVRRWYLNDGYEDPDGPGNDWIEGLGEAVDWHGLGNLIQGVPILASSGPPTEVRVG